MIAYTITIRYIAAIIRQLTAAAVGPILLTRFLTFHIFLLDLGCACFAAGGAGCRCIVKLCISSVKVVVFSSSSRITFVIGCFVM